VGDLGDGEAVVGAQQQAGALGWGEPGKGVAQGLAFGDVRRQVAVGGGEAVIVAGGERHPGEAAAVAQGVKRRVGGDAVEPGRLGPSACRGQRLVGLEEGVLGQVLGLGGVADEGEDVVVERPLIAGKELVEGRLGGRLGGCTPLAQSGLLPDGPMPPCDCGGASGRMPARGGGAMGRRAADGIFAAAADVGVGGRRRHGPGEQAGGEDGRAE